MVIAGCRRPRLGLSLLLVSALFAAPAGATIVGLNQIVTPEIQPAGVLALSAQTQHAAIGNSEQIQFELGLTAQLEAGWFQGLKPGEGLVGSEFNLLRHGAHLLTAGFINWSTRGGGAQPLLEYGYYRDADHFVAGALYANHRAAALLGYRRQLSERFAFAADFQSGSAAFSTIGITCNFTPSLSVNPALYYTNSAPHRFLGYIVFTWNLTVWKERASLRGRGREPTLAGCNPFVPMTRSMASRWRNY